MCCNKSCGIFYFNILNLTLKIPRLIGPSRAIYAVTIIPLTIYRKTQILMHRQFTSPPKHFSSNHYFNIIVFTQGDICHAWFQRRQRAVAPLGGLHCPELLIFGQADQGRKHSSPLLRNTKPVRVYEAPTQVTYLIFPSILMLQIFSRRSCLVIILCFM